MYKFFLILYFLLQLFGVFGCILFISILFLDIEQFKLVNLILFILLMLLEFLLVSGLVATVKKYYNKDLNIFFKVIYYLISPITSIYIAYNTVIMLLVMSVISAMH